MEFTSKILCLLFIWPIMINTVTGVPWPPAYIVLSPSLVKRQYFDQLAGGALGKRDAMLHKRQYFDQLAGGALGKRKDKAWWSHPIYDHIGPFDLLAGGITYWLFGYGISFGKKSTWFCGYSNFMVHTDQPEDMGKLYTHYVFHFSFATAATTIVSGAVAERMKLQGYMIYSIFNTFVYCFPACWAWNETGFLNRLGFFDFAGGCIIHVTGGASALVAAIILGARLGRFERNRKGAYGMSSPVTALTGTFMLWWAWMAFNCGSTYGVQLFRWKVAAKVGVVTLNGSISGGIMGLIISYIIHKGSYDITIIITSILGGLVGVTAGCAVFGPGEALIIGAVGALVAVLSISLLEWLEIDDPVGAVPVHLGAGTWGTLAVGLFGKNEFGILGGYNGLFYDGSFKLLGIQLVGWFCAATWSALCTAAVFCCLAKINQLRMTADEEILGADWTEHKVSSVSFANRLESTMKKMEIEDEKVEETLKMILEQLSQKPKQPNSKVRKPVKQNFVGPEPENNNNNNEVEVIEDIEQKENTNTSSK